MFHYYGFVMVETKKNKFKFKSVYRSSGFTLNTINGYQSGGE